MVLCKSSTFKFSWAHADCFILHFMAELAILMPSQNYSMLSETRATRSIYHVYSVYLVTAQYSEASHEWQDVELEFIAHFCAFIRSSIALPKSMPFTWCVLSLPYGPSYCTHPVVFFPIFSHFSLPRNVLHCEGIEPHTFCFLSLIFDSVACATVQWLSLT